MALLKWYITHSQSVRQTDTHTYYKASTVTLLHMRAKVTYMYMYIHVCTHLLYTSLISLHSFQFLDLILTHHSHILQHI